MRRELRMVEVKGYSKEDILRTIGIILREHKYISYIYVCPTHIVYEFLRE